MEGKFQSKEKRTSGRRTNINQRESAWFTLHIQRPAMFGATFTRREACRMRSSHVWWPSAPSRRILRPPRLRLVDVSFCLVADRNGGKWSAQSWAAQHLFLTPLKKTKRFERSFFPPNGSQFTNGMLLPTDLKRIDAICAQNFFEFSFKTQTTECFRRKVTKKVIWSVKLLVILVNRRAI